MTWEVALPTGKSEALSEAVVFRQRPGRLEKAKLTETGGAFQAEGTSNTRSLRHRTKTQAAGFTLKLTGKFYFKFT